MRIAAFSVALMLAVPAIAHAQASVPAAQLSVQTTVIAELMVPVSIMQGKIAESFHQGFGETLAKDPLSQALEKKYPDVFAAAEASGLKAVTYALGTDLLKLRYSIAALLASQLLPVEQNDMLAFLQTTTGHHIVQMGDQIYDTDKVAKSMSDDPSAATVTQQEIAGSINPSFIGKLSNDEIRTLVVFSNTAAGRKMRVITPMLQQLTANWINTFMSGHMQDLQTQVVVTVRDYVAKADAAHH